MVYPRAEGVKKSPSLLEQRYFGLSLRVLHATGAGLGIALELPRGREK